MKLLRIYMSIITSATRLVKYAQSLVVEVADLKQRLADALANDAADAVTIGKAKADAEIAQAKIGELQALADADVKEDAEFEALVDSVVPAENTP